MLATWSSWGAIPGIFDESKPEWQAERDELRGLLSDREWWAAARTTINAHYTDPRLAATMWRAAGDLGLTSGAVLEPGCGAGTFIGLAPPGTAMTGVELDPVTARITRALYPGATVRAESFSDTDYRTGTFDAAIGNVPFAKVVLHDRVRNQNKHSLHNYFILKSLDLVRPGGLVMVLSSHFTLDAQNPGARREMHAMADLLGALRLPNGTHRRTAGTDALTDLLILRRREPDRDPGDDAWVHTRPIRIGEHIKRVNTVFTEHPEWVLGEWQVEHGMYAADTLQVRTDDLAGVPDRVHDALGTITATARGDGRAITARGPGSPAPMMVEPDASIWPGMVVVVPGEGFAVRERYETVPLPVPATQRAELRSLLAMRNHARELLQREAASLADTAEITTLRRVLAREYTNYRDRFGPINRYTPVVTSRIDPDTGEPKVQRRRPPVMRWLRSDPFASLIRALEVFDETSQAAAPASLLTERVVIPRSPVLGVDTPEDAIAVALDTDGDVSLPRVADLLGLEPAEAREALGELVFDDPRTDRLITRAEYLSGNVLAKLEAAQAELAERPELAANVAALRAVMPPPLGVEEIHPSIGAVWISPEDYRQFIDDLLGYRRSVVEHGGGSVWAVKTDQWSVAATSEWGTARRPAGDILQALLEQRTISVYDTLEDNTRVLNPTETEAARDKANAMQERFADWLWENPQRAARLAADYNRRFNSIVLRDYTTDGGRLSLPGIAATFDPRPHQRAAVARILAEPAVGLFHEVGAGKTAEMVIGAMELKRLGMVSKPVVVVPNHMLEQFSREWLQIYPQARVLAASSDDLAKDNRRDFVARVATGDWDGVVMTRSAFSRLNLSVEAHTAYVEAELERQRAQLERLKATGGSLTVKRIEKRLAIAEERLKELRDLPRDPGISFEDTGIDYLIVDEAHAYKNLSTMSNIPDANIAGSKQATDLHMKAEWLRGRHGRRVLTVATATPIANSVTEAHVMCRYLRPDLLRDADVLDFDQWAATFGRTVTELEMAPTGGSRYREKTRFAGFQNVPEMLRMWHVFADVKSAEDLNLPAPALAARASDGLRAPETVVVPPTAELLDFVAELGRRADALSGRAEPGEDNMLSITTDGRRAALDLRLVGRGEPTGPTKLTVAADRIANIWRAERDRQYLDATGATSGITGGLQLVFCDQSTPKPDRWNVYSALKSELIDRGLPAKSVRFIHDATNDAEKGRLFAACRAGEVAVLLGSTEKMGVGTNVQARAVALHHLDCPWRPADLQQRDGRIVRQGNQNDEVQILRYTTGRSFDSYSWQTVERKQKFINQILRGRLDVREIEDIGDAALSLGETKALAADDPLVLDKATVDARLARLERLARAYHRNASMLSYRAEQASGTIRRADADEPAIAAAINATTPTAGDAFAIRINGREFDDRVEAARTLRDTLMPAFRPYGQDLAVRVHLGGHDLVFARDMPVAGQQQWSGRLADVPRSGFTLTAGGLADGIGSIRTLENRVHGLPATLAKVQHEREQAGAEEAAARAAAGQPFKHADELTATRSEAERINAQLAERAKPTPATAVDDRAADDPAAGDAAEAARLAAASYPATVRGTPGPRAADSTRPAPPGAARRWSPTVEPSRRR